MLVYEDSGNLIPCKVPFSLFVENASFGVKLLGRTSVNKLNELIDFARDCWKTNRKDSVNIIGTWLSELVADYMDSETEDSIDFIKRELSDPLPKLRKKVWYYYGGGESKDVPPWNSKWDS